jgi:hypothetical protein
LSFRSGASSGTVFFVEAISIDLLQLFTTTLFFIFVSESVGLSFPFSFRVSVSSDFISRVHVSLTHAISSCGGTFESYAALAWSWDGTIVVTLVPHNQVNSSL